MLMENMKAVIFDMDGVIFDSEKICLDAWLILAEKYKLADIEENFRRCIGTNAAETRRIMIEAYGNQIDYDSVVKEASDYYHSEVARKGLPMKAGVRELLTYLKDKGYIIGLASSTRQSLVEKQLRDAGIYDFFNGIVGGDQLKRSKPAPDIYLMACEKNGVKPEEAYAVEDAYNGIRSAYEAGLKPIMVPDMLPPTEEMQEKAVAIRENLRQLMELL